VMNLFKGASITALSPHPFPLPGVLVVVAIHTKGRL